MSQLVPQGDARHDEGLLGVRPQPQGHAEGTKTGDLIHMFQSGSIQMVTDAVVDPAGNVWAANNWNVIDALGDENPVRPTSTWGGGDGIVAIYGVASPVKTPVMGQARPY